MATVVSFKRFYLIPNLPYFDNLYLGNSKHSGKTFEEYVYIQISQKVKLHYAKIWNFVRLEEQ